MRGTVPTQPSKTGVQEYFGKEQERLRLAAREVIKKEVIPHIDEWEEAGAFPRAMYDLFGELGFLGVGYPEEVGGSGGDLFDQIAMNEELMRSGSGGFAAGIGSLNIALPPIIRKGTAEIMKEIIPKLM